MAAAAKRAGIVITADETIPQGSTDLAGISSRLREGGPAVLLTILGPSTTPFFKAYGASDWTVPVTGRVDVSAALAAAPDALRARGMTSVTVFTPLLQTSGVQDSVAKYRSHYGLEPTQRSFFVYESVHRIADAITRAKADTPIAIEEALKTTKLASRLGASYEPDDHNHAHTPVQIIGLSDGKPVVVATE